MVIVQIVQIVIQSFYNLQCNINMCQVRKNIKYINKCVIRKKNVIRKDLK